VKIKVNSKLDVCKIRLLDYSAIIMEIMADNVVQHDFAYLYASIFVQQYWSTINIEKYSLQSSKD